VAVSLAEKIRCSFATSSPALQSTPERIVEEVSKEHDVNDGRVWAVYLQSSFLMKGVSDIEDEMSGLLWLPTGIPFSEADLADDA
jgi:hypothetical protein